MDELKRILDNINPEKLVAHALYGTVWNTEHISSYDAKLENAYETFLAFLKELYPAVSPTTLDDGLIRLITVNSEIYLEIGMVAGYMLNKELEEKFHSLKLDQVLKPVTNTDEPEYP